MMYPNRVVQGGLVLGGRVPNRNNIFSITNFVQPCILCCTYDLNDFRYLSLRNYFGI